MEKEVDLSWAGWFSAASVFMNNPTWGNAMAFGRSTIANVANATVIGVAGEIWSAHNSCNHLSNEAIA